MKEGNIQKEEEITETEINKDIIRKYYITILFWIDLHCFEISKFFMLSVRVHTDSIVRVCVCVCVCVCERGRGGVCGLCL
jgi:hypothetical protein